MAKPSLDDALKAIAANAPALRESGIEWVEVEGVKFKLAPPDAPQEPPKPEERQSLHPADDPETFGLKPGSKPPGRRFVVEDKQ